MGNCVRKQRRIFTAPPSSTFYFKNLEDLKDSLVYHIFRLHHLILKCKKCVEECLILNKKSAAFLAKGKEILLRRKIEDLQELIKIADEFDETTPRDKKLEKKLIY